MIIPSYSQSPLIRHIFIMFLSLIFQLMLFNFMDISLYIPFAYYLFFIITLPVKIKKIILIFIGFLYGLLLDLLTGVGGLYAMTTTAIVFIRPAILRLFFVRDERYRRTLPTSKEMGVLGFITYSFIILTIGSLVFIGIESYGYVSFWDILIKSLYAALITIPFVYLSQLLFFCFKNKNNG